MKPWQYITAGLVGGGVLVFAIMQSKQANNELPVPRPIALAESIPSAPDPTEQPVPAAEAVARIGYTRGADNAAIHVIEFSDFGCPFCSSFARETYPALHKEFVASGKVRWTYVPFVMGMFPNGSEAAMAAECAAEQGEKSFWTMHDALFADQQAWKRSGEPAQLFSQYAGRLGLDAARFTSCYGEQRQAARITASNRAAERAGVRATPTFFVNGQRIEGALPAEQFRALLGQAAR